MKNAVWQVGLGLALVVGLFVSLEGCGEDDAGPECSISSDCTGGMLCDRGHCVDPSSNNNNPTDGGNNEPACPGAKDPMPGDLILNEVLADPSATAGDANGDGVSDTGQDEFLEFYNNSGEALAISGLKIFKSDLLKVTVATACLDAGHAFVVFGGIKDGAEPPAIAETVVEIPAKEMGLNNDGAPIRVETASGTVLLDVTYPGGTDQSVTLSPQLTGTTYVNHTSLAEALFSPGTCPDGKALATGCPGVGPDCDAASAALGDLVLNEVLSRVPLDLAGDANQDGVRDSGDDEFVELVNVASRRVRVAGFTIYKDQTRKHTIATECLDPGQGLVVFGGLQGGAQPPAFGSTIVEIGSNFGFTDGGVTVNVYDANNSLIDFADLGSSQPMSFTRQNQLTRESVFVGHTTLQADRLFSPGTCPDGAAFTTGCPGGGGDPDSDVGGDVADAGDVPIDPCDQAPMATATTLILNEILTDVAAASSGSPGDTNGDGVIDAAQDEFVELWNASGGLLRIEGIQIKNNGTTKHTLRGCLEPSSGIVVFGGLQAAATLPVYADMTVVTADSTFTFSNSGGTFTMVAPDSSELVTYAYPAGHDVSFVRTPELSNASAWVEHNIGDPAPPAFSPGTCRNGGSLATGCP